LPHGLPALSRLAASNGRIILLRSRFGKPGHFHEMWTEGGDAYEQ
jgi:hypothetical protein